MKEDELSGLEKCVPIVRAIAVMTALVVLIVVMIWGLIWGMSVGTQGPTNQFLYEQQTGHYISKAKAAFIDPSYFTNGQYKLDLKH